MQRSSTVFADVLRREFVTRMTILAESLVNDLRFAFRTLRSNLALSTVALLSLALGIGATIAIFSVMYALAFKPLPVPRPDQLVAVVRGDSANLHTYAEWIGFRDRQDIFSSVLAYNNFDTNFELTDGKRERKISGLYVSGSYFRKIGRAHV